MINLIYILIFLILIFVAYLGLKAVSYGIEAKQKKQEFGGGIAFLENHKCKAKNIIDEQSSLKIKNEF